MNNIEELVTIAKISVIIIAAMAKTFGNSAHHMPFRKTSKPSRIESTVIDALNSLFYVYDQSSRCKFLLDTGAEVSVFPTTLRDRRFGRKGLELLAANGSRIKRYSSKLLKIRLSCGTFRWSFIVADVGMGRRLQSYAI